MGTQHSSMLLAVKLKYYLIGFQMNMAQNILFQEATNNHPQHLVFANVVTTMRYISAHRLNVGFDPCLPYHFPCVLRIRSAGVATLFLSSTRDVASWADTWPFDRPHHQLTKQVRGWCAVGLPTSYGWTESCQNIQHVTSQALGL